MRVYVRGQLSILMLVLRDSSSIFIKQVKFQAHKIPPRFLENNRKF